MVTECTLPAGCPRTYLDNTAVVNTPYFYRVSASNVVGDTAVYPASLGFPTSNRRLPVVQRGPGAVRSRRADRGRGHRHPRDRQRSGQRYGVAVTFTAPASNGGSPITSYTVTSSPGGITASGARDHHHRQRPDQRHGLHLHRHGN